MRENARGAPPPVVAPPLGPPNLDDRAEAAVVRRMRTEVRIDGGGPSVVDVVVVALELVLVVIRRSLAALDATVLPANMPPASRPSGTVTQ
jgi:hypothetical protein